VEAKAPEAVSISKIRFKRETGRASRNGGTGRRKPERKTGKVIDKTDAPGRAADQGRRFRPTDQSSVA
jgi:hypothetical protein